MHISTKNADIILAKEFQKNLSDLTRAHGLIDNGKDIKIAIERKLTEREYHVQDKKDLQHKSVNISFACTKFPALPLFGLHEKPYVIRGFSKHSHL